MPPARVTLWVGTLLSLALLARSWLLEPVAGVWLAAVWAMLLGFIALGLWQPAWQMFAPVLAASPDDEPELVLSFDGVPAEVELGAAIERLHDAKVSATFCVPIDQLLHGDRHAHTLVRLVREGHTLALLVNERGIPSLDRLNRARIALEQQCGDAQHVLPLLRCQRRRHTPELAKRVRRAGLTLLGGSVGWPVQQHFADTSSLRRGIRPGALLCADVALASQPAVAELTKEATLQGLAWVSLQLWLDEPSRSGSGLE